MKILLTNDDGIHAGGLIELGNLLAEVSELFVVAPRLEQSGVSQMLTYRRPLFPQRLPREGSRGFAYEGYSVDGTPVDCVKVALFELCPWKPDLVISGINGGLNAGTNVNHSGTIGGALTGANYGIPSMAISMEWAKPMDFANAAKVAWTLIKQYQSFSNPRTILNINIPTAALLGDAETVVCPAETNLLGTHFDKGGDPKARPYYWASVKPDPEPSPFVTDCQALAEGKVSVSPLTSDINHHEALKDIKAIV